MASLINSVSTKLLNNILVYPSIDGSGWSKEYNTNIIYTKDGPDSNFPTVATFTDAGASPDGNGYWYSYGDYAPQDPGVVYTIQIWVKVNTSGSITIQAYTGDNTENSTYGTNARLWTSNQTVNYGDGWKLLSWDLITNNPWYSDSLSFHWTGNWYTNGGTVSISAPKMVPKQYLNESVISCTYEDVLISVDASIPPVTWDNLDLTTFDYLEVTETSEFQDIDYHLDNVRYIKDWLNGSTANTANHWVEIQAFDYNGINIASGKSVSYIGTLQASPHNDPTIVVNGNTASTDYVGINAGLSSITVDLGSGYSLESLTIWHYYADGRTYHNTMTEVSADGINWYRVFDSRISGEYAETSSGHQLIL